LDPECEDAKRALLDVQAMQLCGLGYKKEHALKALNLTIDSITHCANVEVIDAQSQNALF
jgi:hypothetical protein